MMNKITPQFMPHVERCPHFMEAVRRSKGAAGGSRSVSPVEERLETFRDDPFLLYACLWYAYSEGVPVTFAAGS